ncbi:50S ribosomal protein L25/general stress protein Ctc [Polaribacter sp. Z014]|uniref:50S ribosomal protein L25/general stress protein Ctc n=1 Tax=Polaribacter sp. Z014 TaxID=2927126 RepID=UPI0020227D97|nr:50S ribosomal protein L25/general stress protein Ctc [Polaribacter sp. Z014]MCL7761967.1 50S ribosomal protein L25/general stress protein Ctc [Polaribacter sp. Z014]
MKSISIKGSKRESVGKVATKALRNAGMVPCVIYGGENPIHFSAEEKAFKKLVFTPNVYTASLDIDGQKIPAILQDIQFHPVTDKIIHVDFYQLFDDKEITMKIPVQLTGTSPGVLNGGSLRFTNRKLRVKALPANLPDFVTADISKLKIGSKLVVTSLATDGYTFMHPDNTVVVQVRTSRNASVEEGEEEEEGAEATEAAAE